MKVIIKIKSKKHNKIISQLFLCDEAHYFINVIE